jgi:hypothetical protein
VYQYCNTSIAAGCKILENTGNTSIADTGRFWKILVIPVLQILEDSGKYWLYQYYRYWKIRYEVVECTFIFPESSSICNTGITSIFQNLPVSAILVLPVFPRIFRYLKYSYFGNDQYLLVLQILEDTEILVLYLE